MPEKITGLGNGSLFNEAVLRMSNELKFSIEDSSMLIKEFIESLNSYIDTIKIEFNSREWSKLSRSAHTLKGLASNMRVKPLFESLSKLEQAAKTEDEKICYDNINEIDQIYSVLLKNLK